jgi:hypothetical protein
MNTSLAHEQDIDQQIEECYSKINGYRSQLNDIKSELDGINSELESLSDEQQKYEILTGVCENLEKLKEIGGNDLFWTGLAKDGEIDVHLNRVRDQASFFERRIKKVTDRRDEAIEKRDYIQNEIAFHAEEIEYLKEIEEEAKFDFIVDRDIKPESYRVVVMPWTKKTKDEKKFRKILIISLLISLLIGLLVPLYKIAIPDRSEVVEVPERMTKLIKRRIKEKDKAAPKKRVENKQIDKLKPEKDKKKQPSKQERQQARENVKRKGVLAFKNNFADLLDEASLEKLGTNANLSNAGSTAKRTKRSILTASARSSSGGISASQLSQNVAGTGDQIEAVAFSRVESDIGTGVGEDRPLSNGPGPSRTDEEIQIVFDKYKATLYRIYNRELRVNPTLQGKVVLRMTIEPDGTVSLAKVESTDMNAKSMLEKVVARVKRFNFGAKEGVPSITILYPIDFLPAS